MDSYSPVTSLPPPIWRDKAVCCKICLALAFCFLCIAGLPQLLMTLTSHQHTEQVWTFHPFHNFLNTKTGVYVNVMCYLCLGWWYFLTWPHFPTFHRYLRRLNVLHVLVLQLFVSRGLVLVLHLVSGRVWPRWSWHLTSLWDTPPSQGLSQCPQPPKFQAGHGSWLQISWLWGWVLTSQWSWSILWPSMLRHSTCLALIPPPQVAEQEPHGPSLQEKVCLSCFICFIWTCMTGLGQDSNSIHSSSDLGFSWSLQMSVLTISLVLLL